MYICIAKITENKDHFLIDVDRRKSKYPEKNLRQCHFIHKKSHLLEIKHRSP
jgi:hypothetical protein